MNKRVLCFGELLLRLSAPGKELLLQSPQLNAHIGGAEANVAVSLTRLGHNAAVVTTLPDNAIGRSARAELLSHGVDVQGIHMAAGRMGLYFLTHGAMHRPSEVLYDRADSAFARATATTHDWPSLLRGAHWLHVSGITPAVSAAAAEAALSAMRTARAQGTRISFDCNFRARVWGDRAKDAPGLLRQLAAEADLLFAEARDIDFMFATQFGQGTEAPGKAAAYAFEAMPRIQWLASTARLRESVDVQEYAGTLRSRKGLHTSRKYSLAGIVDRIGAGDAFAAGLIDQLLNDADAQAAIEFAVAAAVVKHSIPGDFNLVDRSDIMAVMSELSADVRR
jgi:2-dehydro-3-deoxygluconokinase